MFNNWDSWHGNGLISHNCTTIVVIEVVLDHFFRLIVLGRLLESNATNFYWRKLWVKKSTLEMAQSLNCIDLYQVF